jgi:hypothetical protein
MLVGGIGLVVEYEPLRGDGCGELNEEFDILYGFVWVF